MYVCMYVCMRACVYVEFIEVVWQGRAVNCDTTPQSQGKLAATDDLDES